MDGTLGTCSTATACYFYDALGHRVDKQTGSYHLSYIHDLSGNGVTEYCAPCTWGTGWNRGYVYMNGQQVAEYSGGTTYFVHPDHLGSARLRTALNQSVFDSTDFLPFGEIISSSYEATHYFTGDELDYETYLDHTQFRQYSSQFGRWMHADPAGLAAVSPSNPQSWNRYSYVLNNPLRFTDPTGKRCMVLMWWSKESWGDCGGGGSLSEGDILSNFSAGNDIFDALAGAPGTYVGIGIHGNLTWGFSLDLYTSVANQGGPSLTRTGWTYFIQNFGTYSMTSGFLADLLNAEQQNAKLAAQLPAGAIQDIGQRIGALQNIDFNNGQDLQPLQNYFWNAVGDYLQDHGLDMNLQLPLYENLWTIFQMTFSPSSPLKP